jgi:hypothetical protein
MHMLHMVRAIGEEHLAVAERAAEYTDLRSGAESRRKETVGVEALEPLAVEPIGVGPTGSALGLAGIDQEYLQAPGLQELKQGHPVHPGRCHRDGGHATVKEPVGQGVKVSGEGTETTHRLGVAPRRHGDPVLGFADVKARGMGVADLESVREHGGEREHRRRGRWTRGKAIVFVGRHGSLRKLGTRHGTAVGAGGRKNVQSPKRDQDEACHQ